MPPYLPLEVYKYKTYEPTMEEFHNFREFIEKIEFEDQAHLAGIVKIKPPKEWVPRRAGYGIETFSDIIIRSPKKQRFQWHGDWGAYHCKIQNHLRMSVEEYYKMSQSDR